MLQNSLHFLYGPTETTLAKCYYQVPDQPTVGVQPVGWPLPETQALVFNSHHQPSGIGELGEIVLRTPFSTLGYINATETENSRFVKNPCNNFELQLAQIWCKILPVNQVGVQDNFFDLGGHSLLAVYLMTQIKQEFGKDMPIATLFQNPTIEQLALVVQKDAVKLLLKCHSSYFIRVIITFL